MVAAGAVQYQAFILQMQKKAKRDLETKIEKLKKERDAVFIKIGELEKELTVINDTEISYILEKHSAFENANSERITPYFLKVIKGSKNFSSLNSLKDNNGKNFNSDLERKNYIREHFVKIYKKDPNEPNDLAGCIENFLGEEIVQNPLVTESRLNEQKRTTLDEPLTMDELNKALDGANGATAAGIDGLNNKFIKKFWYILNVPLLKYAETCFQKGKLTRSFKTAVFKLIPKKGDCSDINKWRPISLLSCLYKVISRAINNRLKLVFNRFTTRAQKGFTSHRFIQEVLINVLETINHCKNSGTNGALISIDQSKAFDTISHKYCSEVFKFFGFGNNFINMMETIGTGRTATILYEDSTYSQEILLERCRPQGDGPSPIQYNMAEGILLIKIELDPNVASVYQQMLPPNFTMNFNPPKDLKPIEKEYESHLSKENNRKTDKTNAFADDTTVATKAEYNSLKNLKQILEDFAKFSGLNCNVEKMTITLIGNIAPPTQEILDLGFKFVDKFTLRGLEISNNLEDSLMCFEKIHDKIVSIADF